MKTRLLIIGASGLLGRTLAAELSASFSVSGTYHTRAFPGGIQLDLDDAQAVAKCLEHVRPEIIVLAAAIARVDAYEKDAGISERQILSAQRIAGWCEKNHARLVFVSSDAVFDGLHAPYSEQDAPNPVSAYGKNKADIEAVASQVPRHLILRVSVLYGLPVSEGGFVNKAISLLSEGKEVSAVHDWVKTPTLTNDIAVSLRLLLEKKVQGIVHVAGASSHTMYAAACLVAREFAQPESLVKSISFADLHLPANRGGNTCLSTKKLNSLGIVTRTFSQGLSFVHSEMAKKRG